MSVEAPGTINPPNDPPPSDKASGQDAPTETSLFDKGYGKGTDKGRKETIEALGFDNLDDAKQFITDYKASQEAALTEQGKFKELLEKRNTEFDKLQTESADWKASHDRWTTYKEEKRNTLLEQIPENERDIYKDLKLEHLEQHVAKISTAPTTPPGRPGGTRGSYKNLLDLANAYTAGHINEAEYIEQKKNL